VGYVSGETEVSHQAVTCCVAPAPLHVLPEIGFWLSPNLTLSLLLGRIGFPRAPTSPGRRLLAPAGFLRTSYLFGKDRGLYIHGDVGGGFIRHTIKLTRSSATSNQGDTDTYVTGPLLLGRRHRYIFPLGGGGLRFVVDFNLLAGIPIVSSLGSGARASKPGFALHGDLSLAWGMPSSWSVYLLRCRDGSLYTGVGPRISSGACACTTPGAAPATPAGAGRSSSFTSRRSAAAATRCAESWRSNVFGGGEAPPMSPGGVRARAAARRP
jgi:hypothetical protein